MNECKTFTSEIEEIDPLYIKQKEDVANMRASLLAVNSGQPHSARLAVQKITAMRFYHQLTRIIKYTEMMDKIEAKMYEAIDNTLDNMNTSSPATWMTLIGLQERLQKCMIESQKLLEPYLDLESLSFVEPPESETEQQSFGALIMEQDSRDKLRASAQAVLSAIQAQESSPDKEDINEEEDSNETSS